MESIHVNFDELPQKASAHNSSDPAPTCQTMAVTTSVISSENITQAEPNAEYDEVADDEFINIFSTPMQ
nr:hypothetical protein [Tanacetum cinerariifolium]